MTAREYVSAPFAEWPDPSPLDRWWSTVMAPARHGWPPRAGSSPESTCTRRHRDVTLSVRDDLG